MPDQPRYAYLSRTRFAVFFALTAVDSLLTALFGVPPIRWCARRLAMAAREMYLADRYGPPSESVAPCPWPCKSA
ncbi:MAG: hypothetical protein JWN52_477 [Actinomycetia bacterium]|nr:hypothetical protein [Actinomycetes bacterium]